MKFKISFFGVLMLVCLVFTHAYISLAALLAAALHELGHLMAAKLCHISLKELKLDIFGAAITPRGAISSYRKEIVFALSGPAVNIFTFMLLLPWADRVGEFGRLFIIASAFLGMLNLLPLEGFDGARALCCGLSLWLPPHVVSVISRVLAFSFAFGLWMLSVYLLLRKNATLSLFVFSFALLCKMYTGAKTNLWEDMKD